jgi:hypothetical protein
MDFFEGMTESELKQRTKEFALRVIKVASTLSNVVHVWFGCKEVVTAIENQRSKIENSYQDGAGGGAVAGGVLAKGFGPGAVAVAVVGFADEGEFAAGREFFFEAAEVGAEFIVGGDAEEAVFEIVAEGEGELFFHGVSEIDGLDFPAEAFAGAFGELSAEAGAIDAGAFELRQSEEREELGFDLGKGLVEEFEAEAVVGDGADFFAEVDDAEVVVAGDVDAEVEGIFDFRFSIFD